VKVVYEVGYVFLAATATGFSVKRKNGYIQLDLWSHKTYLVYQIYSSVQ
jgi:hypothetical protein